MDISPYPSFIYPVKDNRWVPGWMCSPRPQTDATERADNLADAA
ncbi:TPA: chromosome partitioning protein ParB [Escherichia coli]|nr:chromosome partitioning protein ParB [Escherichia coli]HDY2095277.1 chromosome partitioning protein ParB [Escherichia coli]